MMITDGMYRPFTLFELAFNELNIALLSFFLEKKKIRFTYPRGIEIHSGVVVNNLPSHKFPNEMFYNPIGKIINEIFANNFLKARETTEHVCRLKKNEIVHIKNPYGGYLRYLFDNNNNNKDDDENNFDEEDDQTIYSTIDLKRLYKSLDVLLLLLKNKSASIAFNKSGFLLPQCIHHTLLQNKKFEKCMKIFFSNHLIKREILRDFSENEMTIQYSLEETIING